MKKKWQWALLVLVLLISGIAVPVGANGNVAPEGFCDGGIFSLAIMASALGIAYFLFRISQSAAWRRVKPITVPVLLDTLYVVMAVVMMVLAVAGDRTTTEFWFPGKPNPWERWGWAWWFNGLAILLAIVGAGTGISRLINRKRKGSGE